VTQAADQDGLSEYWEDLKPRFEPARMTDDQLRDFVNDVISGRIFVDRQVDDPAELQRVFYPLMFGAFDEYNWESVKSTLGCIYEYVDAALGRSVNGHPCFMSMRVLHVEDWKRAEVAIKSEIERRKAIPI